MLQTLRRLISFGDWSRNHPSEPPPGGDLDATFDALFNALSDLEARLAEIRRDDGTLKAGSITADALDPALASNIASLVLDQVNSQLDVVVAARNEAVSARILVDQALVEVEAAAGRALLAAQAVESAKNPVILSLDRAASEANAVLDRAAAIRDASPDPLDFAGNAEAWADASRIWAEWMPDTIPDNTTAMMDITGDHWSSRWWANYAATTVAAVVAQAGGAEVSTTPPEGPLAHHNGRLWWDADSGELFIWYDDGSSAQWVEVGGNVSTAAAIVSDTPPEGDLPSGQIWWNSSNSNLYAWYDDGDSQQWVQINTVGSAAAGSFSNVFVAAAGSVDFGSGDVTITHSANTLTFAGASSGYVFDDDILPLTNGTRSLGGYGKEWLGLVMAPGGFIDFGVGDVTISNPLSGQLLFSGAGNGYQFSHLIDISQSGAGQIQFPSTQHASADANTLDDYAESTFTPAITFGGAATGVTYTTQSGRYTKVGNRVYFNILLTLSAKGSSTGSVAITSLPFAAAASPLQVAVEVGTYVSFTGLTGVLKAYIGGGATTINLLQTGATGCTVITDAAATATTSISLSGHYATT